MQEKTMSNDLITTVHDLVLESPIGAKAIAQAVGKSPIRPFCVK